MMKNKLRVIIGALLMGVAVVWPTGAQSFTDALVVVNLGAGEVLVYDARNFRILTKFPTGKEPHDVVVSSDGRVAYVADSGPRTEPGKTITVVDLRNRMVRGQIRLGQYDTPHDLKLSSDDKILWVGCAPARTVLEIEAHSGKILKEWKTGQEGGWILTATPDDRKIYVANLEGGSVSVIDRTTGKVSVVTLEVGPMGIDVSPDGREVWVANFQKHTITVIDVNTDKAVATFACGGQSPVRLKFTADGKRVLVPNGASKSVTVFDAASRRLVATIALRLAPKVIAIAADNRRAFVTNPSDNQVTVINLATYKEISTFPVSARPDGIAFAPRHPYRPKSQVAFTIAEKDLIPEGIAYDAATKTFFVSSTYKRKIVAVDPRGRARDFITEMQDGFMGGVGMRVDVRRRLLWAISSDAGIHMPMKASDAKDEGRSGVFKYDLNTGRLLKKYLLDNATERHFLNDLTLTAAGDVYLSDSVHGAIYTIRQAKDELEVFLKNDQTQWPNGLDLSSDEETLFVAASNHIAVIKLETREIWTLTPPDYDGSDGLYFYRNSLLSVDAYNDAGVIARYALSPDYKRVTGVSVVEKDHPLLIQPTTGVVVGNEFYFIAASQLQSFLRHFKKDGSYPMAELSDVVILRTKL